MRFGLFIPQGWRMDLVGVPPEQQWGVMAGLARAADGSQAWESVWVYDHFHTVPVASHEATHEAWTLMSALAAVTGRVRLGQMCTCMAYRNPVYLAKVAATVDIISEGRVEMGIGAGWYEEEWLAYGYGFPSAGERLSMLAEGVEIFRQAWTKGEVSFDGENYLADRAIVAPRPLQGTSLPGSARNGIPMWIAGGGENKTLRIAAEYADYTNFDGAPETFERKSAILAERCSELGRDYDEIVRSANYNVIIGATEKDVEAKLELTRFRLLDGGASESKAERQIEMLRTGSLVGTPDQITTKLVELYRLGMTYAICYFPEAAFDMSGIDMFERLVIPELHDAHARHRRH